MAWKKIKDKKIKTWVSNETKIIVLDNPLGGWDAVIQKDGEEDINNFDTKSEALKFARGWMRKHPEG